MIDRIIVWCVSHRGLVFAAALALSLWGVWTMRRAPIDALPDLSDIQVIVSTEWPGHSPDLMEDHVTFPIVSALVSAPSVRSVRAVNDFGVSFIYVVFDDATDRYWARSRVLEQLQTIRAQLPEGVAPTVAADATGVGWVFEYALVDTNGRYGPEGLRSFQDWTMKYALSSVPGVAEVASIGGFVKQYQVNLDPSRLAALNLSPKQVVDTIRASNEDIEGRILEFSGREYMVRSRGTLSKIEDINAISLGTGPGGVPIRVSDVAEVRVGPDIRRGVAELDGRGEVVGGIVIMRVGENALSVIDGVKTRLAQIQRTLPEGVTLLPTYDRSILIHESISTLRTILVEEIVAVLLVVGAFLFHFRSALIPIIALPVAIIASFIPLTFSGVSSNIMSLGGIALAIGVLVDAAVVMVENGYRSVVEDAPEAEPDRLEPVIRAARQIGRPVFLSLAIIVVSFMPVFLLEAQEGRLFFPLALTKTAGAAAAGLLAITLVPALMTVLLGGRRHERRQQNWLTRQCAALYEPVLRLALRRKWAFLIGNAAVIPLVALLIPTMGREFMPPLYEGSALYMPSVQPGISVTEVTRLLQKQDRVLAEFPEVERVFGTAGRATTATDNSPLGMVNTILTLKPRESWRPGLTPEKLQAEMDQALQIPGVSNVWTQPIRGRLDMLSTGIKTPVGIKILGSDLGVIQNIGRDVARILQGVQGTESVYAERVGEGYFADIRIDRAAIGRYRLTMEDVQEVIQATIGGKEVGKSLEGREQYSITVRYQQDFRGDVDALKRVLVKTPDGAQVPLGQLSAIALTSGPAMIRDENGQLVGYVYVQADSRDIGGYVARARDALSAALTLPAGYRLDWSGQYESQVRAASRLRIIVPIVVLAIFFILYLTFRSGTEAMIVMLSVVYAMTGGVLLQWTLGYNFSVAVWVGYIALFGIAVQTGVIMVIYLHEALGRKRRLSACLTEADLHEATVEGAVLRLRPKLMTVTVTSLGLLPILWSQGIGADVLKPIAAPIVGGMVTSAVHVLIITPVIFFIVKRRAVVTQEFLDSQT